MDEELVDLRRRIPLKTIGAKIPIKLHRDFMAIVDRYYNSNVSMAIRQALVLLINYHKKEVKKRGGIK